MDDHDRSALTAAATDAVDDARERFDTDLTAVLDRTGDGYRDRDDTPVTGEEMDEFVDALVTELDDLFDVETDDGLREYLGSKIGYDWSRTENAVRTGRNTVLGGSMLLSLASAIEPDALSHLGDAMDVAQQEPVLGAAGLAGAAGAIGLVDRATKEIESGSYIHMPYPGGLRTYRSINISPDAEPAEYALPTAVAEMTHAYQEMRNSPTFDHPLYEEGMDVGTQIAIGDRMQEDWMDDDDIAFRRTYTLVNAVRATHDDDEDGDWYEEIGIDPDEAEAITDSYERHSSPFRDRDAAVIGGAALDVAADRHGDEIYAEVFQGDYDRMPDWA